MKKNVAHKYDRNTWQMKWHSREDFAITREPQRIEITIIVSRKYIAFVYNFRLDVKVAAALGSHGIYHSMIEYI